MQLFLRDITFWFYVDIFIYLFFYFFPCVEKHIIVGAEEGIYSLNFSEQLHEAEMEQVITLLGGG